MGKKNYFTDEETAAGYKFTDDGKSIQFIFDASHYDRHFIRSVFIMGSFNDWQVRKDWKLKKLSGSSRVYVLSRPVSQISIPGNSGTSEFKFCITKKITGKRDYVNSLENDGSYSMCTNKLIVFPGCNIEELKEEIKQSAEIKKLSDFNLETEEGKEEISNVRRVPGTACLYRGYHPYILSRPDFETERTRDKLVKYFLGKYGVKSIITLCGEEKAADGLEEISEIQKSIIKNGNQLYIDTNYDIVYYHSAEKSFGDVIARIVRFIITHPGPYYIHCRLGTDRTGTTSAAMAALCGADFNSICEDYEKTNRMGIGEYRNRKLLKFSFEKLLGKPMEEVKDLQKEYAAHFIENGYLTAAEIEKLQAKLKA